MKNSFIFSSNACKACDDKPFEPSERDVLRTTTEDICCTCGAVLQTFPAMTGFIPAQNAIPIPKAVSEVLEKLLKRRLFILGKGAQPRRTDHSFFDSERMAKTLAHRAGEQIYMTLRGPGNCSAELRWNYSSKFRLPKFPWEEFDYTTAPGQAWSSRGRQKIELKPDLANLEFPRHPRIVRSCDALSDFHFTGAVVDKRNRWTKALRFEKRCELEEQPIETTEDLCLVIKAELSWLQVGSTFGDDGGPRVYNNSNMYQGYPVSVEEAVDYAVYAAMNSQHHENSSIHHRRSRLGVVAAVGDPLAIHSSANYYTSANYQPGRAAVHRSRLDIRHNGEDYQGPFITADGRRLIPEGLGYYLFVDVPEPRKAVSDAPMGGYYLTAGTSGRSDVDSARILPSLSVTVSVADKVIHEQSFGGKDHTGGYSTSGGMIRYTCDLEKILPAQAGQVVVIRITDESGTEEKTYCFLALKEYEATWNNWRNPIIDEYKRQVIAGIAANEGSWVNNVQKIVTFEKGQAVAVLIDGRWLEATYVDTTKVHTHKVLVSCCTGKAQWEVSAAKPLVDALTEGLHVIAPYNAVAPVTSQAMFAGILSEEAAAAALATEP